MKKSSLSLLAALFLSSCSFGVDSTSPSLQASSVDDFIYTITEDGGLIITGLVDKSRKEVHIPSCFTGIGDHAFEGCSSLTSITLPDSVTSIGRYAFSHCKSLIYNEYDEALYLGNTKTPYLLLFKAKNQNIQSCHVSDSCRFIYDNAFSGCSFLTSITIPDGVTSIGDYAFYNCSSLTSISIPDSVTSIESWVFFGCTSLTSITIPDGVTSIGRIAFSGCSSLTLITIPDSVTYIGYEAFSGCTQLSTISFNGTIAQWNSITKIFPWNENVPATTVSCIDGTVALD